MPKRSDIKKILIIGSGPIVIGQACEFDYSGTQACKALREEGFDVVLINSNPATIMTDPETAQHTYIEPYPDLKDLRALLQFAGENAEQFKNRYGNISPASIGAIQRALLQIERDLCKPPDFLKSGKKMAISIRFVWVF